MTDHVLEHPRRHLEFVVLSFEGPDMYSLVGGLGVRVTEMTKVMARLGYNTRLFFVGDPSHEDYEATEDGLLHYHRWSQWLARQYPKGVYQGEVAKVEDYSASVPEFVVSSVVAKNAERGVTTVILGEDWHTAETVSRIDALLKEKGLSKHALLFWNANNVFGFEAIDFKKLAHSAQLLTISRYMKELMRSRKLETLVVPNGIPPRFWSRVDQKTGTTLRELFPGTLLAKIGRYHPDKRWMMALESVALCKKMGLKPTLVLRGAREEYGQQVRKRGEELGLSWVAVSPQLNDNASILDALRPHTGADILELDFFVPESFLRALYWAASSVLANSGHEPFGLVGLEVMACGGVVMTGSTGEEYVHSFHNGISLSGNDPREIPVYLQELATLPQLERRIRKNGKKTAKLYNWESIVEDFLRKIELCAWSREIDL